MSWRTVLISKISKLDYSLGYLIVRDVNSTVKIHIDEISVLILENTSISLTSALLNELVNKKVKVIFCDEKRNPKSEIIPYYGSHDSSLKIKKQIEWDARLKQELWTLIVEQKISNQAKVLSFQSLPQCEQLYSYINEMKFYDSTNREGHAAKVYFNALFGKDFTRDKDCPINAALNYGYSIILSCFNREIVCSGYLTQLGLFHENMFNHYNLSCDLMEPFRPLVDITVKKITPQEFSKNEKIEILKILSSDVIIEKQKQNLINAIRLYCKSVFRALEDNDLKKIAFPEYEL